MNYSFSISCITQFAFLCIVFIDKLGIPDVERLRGLTGSALDYISLPSSNLGVDISEGCFVLDFASLPLEVARPI